jgi:predicted amidophosphoribosyltransferase
MAECIPISVNSRLLVRDRHTSTQTKLTALERQKNMKEAFNVRHPERLEGKRIILVDDVSTTGATMNSCASVLRNAGADEIVGVALARPQLK